MEQYVVTWKDPDDQPKQSMPRNHDGAMRLAANLLAAKVEEVVVNEDGTLRRDTTRKTKTDSVVTNVRVERWLP